MPNVGRPSRDCHLCRQRRVKCDLGRPGCQRCVKYGKECPGYRDQQELVFRTVNPNPPAAKQKKQQQRTKKQSATDDVDRSNASRAGSTESSSSGSSSDSGSGGESASPWALQVYDTASSETTEYGDDPNDWAIAPSISQHWTAQSIPIVLTVYNSVDFLKNVLRENSFDGPLVWATHLFSRTYVTNLRQPTALSNESAAEASQEIGTYMGKTLSAVGTALKDREGAFRDDIIGAVWMLCNYEIIIGSIGRLETESPWHAHAAGLWSILKTRGKEALHTERGRSIFWPTYSLVQLDAIIGNHECPPEGEEWLEVLRQYSSGFVGFHISIFLTRVSRYQTVATDIVLKRDWTAATAQYSALFSELTEAENDLGTFISSLDRHSHHSDDYMLIMHLASVIKAYNILFLLTNLATHDPLSPTPLEVLYKRREYCLTRVRDSAWKILASTPDLIASLVRDKYNVFTALFNALKLVWPLTAVRLMPTTLPSQKARAAKSLLTIGRHLGVKQATRSYSMVDRIPPEARVPRPLPGQTQEDSQQKTDLCIGYMDGELREPRPEELIGDFAPQVLSSQEKLDVFMI